VAVWGGDLAACLLFTAGVASAQPYGQTPGNLLDQYRALRPAWFAAVTTAANRLSGPSHWSSSPGQLPSFCCRGQTCRDGRLASSNE
jgi:hypothetical protein